MIRNGRARIVAWLAAAGLLAGCGGEGGGGGTLAATPSAPSPVPTATAGCSLRARQDWVAAQIREWYLFPETLPAALDPGGYASLSAYVDALTATARAQRRDRYFTYVTSIAEEDAYYDTGSTAGFGIRLSIAQGQVTVSEAFEGAPALAAGIDRGTRILGIGTNAQDVRPVADLIAAGGDGAVTAALGPSTTGTTRVLRIADATGGGTRDVTVAKADYTLTPVSARYGARIIDDGGRRVGYVNLRTFIDPASAPLDEAFARFKAAGITDVIVDLRYNGGGLVSVGERLANLLGGARATSDVLSYTVFRPEKSGNNETTRFAPPAPAIAPTRIAFIGTGATASASELVINAMTPYLQARSALVGGNTYGKPVGQIARDNAACGDRLRVIAFATQNAARQGDYYDGLATRVAASCRAGDDLSQPLGDAREASVAAALGFLRGGSCTAITASDGDLRTAAIAAPRRPLMPDAPTVAQRDIPGLF